jgi:hypothetical protein
MPRAPNTKNERTLNRELARLARQLKSTEYKKDVFFERCFDELAQDRKQQTRRARLAEQHARRALELVCQAQAAQAQAQVQHAQAAKAQAAKAQHAYILLAVVGVLQAAVVLYTYVS